MRAAGSEIADEDKQKTSFARLKKKTMMIPLANPSSVAKAAVTPATAAAVDIPRRAALRLAAATAAAAVLSVRYVDFQQIGKENDDDHDDHDG